VAVIALPRHIYFLLAWWGRYSLAGAWPGLAGAWRGLAIFLFSFFISAKTNSPKCIQISGKN